MALRDQPYIPLYVDDYLTDEKLNMCSASTQGVYIKILCILHKQTEYGKLLLKQKEKQDLNICLNFASKFAKILPFTVDVILPAIEELIEEEILIVDGDCIYQKRMVKDNYLSLIKAKNGSKGGIKTQEKNKEFAKAKNEANTVNEIEIDIDNSFTNSSNYTSPEKEKIEPLTFSQCIEKMKSDEKLKEDNYFINKIPLTDFNEYLEIFARTKKTENEMERVDYMDKYKYFINWAGFYKTTFEKNRGKQPIPNQKNISLSEETKQKLSAIYIASGAPKLLEKYITTRNIDEVQGINDFERAKKQNVDYMNLQLRVNGNEKIYNY